MLSFAQFVFEAYKSNSRMPSRSHASVQKLIDYINEWDNVHRNKAIALMSQATPEGLFELLHSIRRWYSGGTMETTILKHRNILKTVMRIEPENVVGSFRGFKVANDNPLASSSEGDVIRLKVTRNKGFSSWSTSEAISNRFSGGGKGKTGLVIQIVDSTGIIPVLAPTDQTDEWFDELYTDVIGLSYRSNEKEYLVKASHIKVKVIRVKR